jgi:hypothetical protein
MNRNADWHGACWPASIPSITAWNCSTWKPPSKSRSLCRKGVKLDPANQRVRMIMAFILLFKNELSAGLAEVDQALQLNPNSLIFLENIGYLMTLFGDWQAGPGTHQESDRTKSVLQHHCSLCTMGRLGPAGRIRTGLRGNPALQKTLCCSGIR